MANLKRAAALALSAAMFLQPMTASAVTWKSVVQAINNHSNGGQTTVRGDSPDENDIDILVDADGKATITGKKTGGTITGGLLVGGPPWLNVSEQIRALIIDNVDIFSDEKGYGVYVENGMSSNVTDIQIGGETVVHGNVVVNARTDTTLSMAGKVEGEMQANAYTGTIVAKNSGVITGEFKGSAEGDRTSSTIVNQKGGEVGALDGFSLGEGATTTITNGGTAGKLLANALVGGKTEAKNDGNVVSDMSGWSKGDGSTLTLTNTENGASGMMSVESYLKGQATATNNGLAEGGMGGYAEDGRVKLNNNGEVEGNMAVGTGNHGYAGIRNGRDGTVYGDIKGWTNGQNSMVTIVNLGEQKQGKDAPDLKAAVFAAEPEDAEQGEETQETYHDQADVKETVVSKDAQPGDAGEGVLTGENRGEGMVVIEDQNSGTASVNGKTADAMLNVTSSTTQAEIQSQLAALPIWEKPGEYTVLIKCVGENDEVTYEAVTICVEEEKPAEPMDTSEEAFRHEMEMKRQAGAVGGVYGSPYWVKQLYLGYHSYNLRLFVGETRENFREELSWSADGSKSVSLRVNDENPEKLTMRFDEKVLEVLERTNITTVTLLNKSGAAVMQYNVSDLRAAYDGFGLDGADQLVVGSADDDVMKIDADGQLVPVES